MRRTGDHSILRKGLFSEFDSEVLRYQDNKLDIEKYIIKKKN